MHAVDSNKTIRAHMRKLGRKGGNTTKRRKGKKWFSRIAKLSHPRKVYRGGRKKKKAQKK